VPVPQERRSSNQSAQVGDRLRNFGNDIHVVFPSERQVDSAFNFEKASNSKISGLSESKERIARIIEYFHT
jgi:hypothetical protein